MAKNKSDIDIQEKDIKTKPKKTKKIEKVEPLEPKVSQVTEPLDDVKVDVEIDCRSLQPTPGIYIRRKRSI